MKSITLNKKKSVDSSKEDKESGVVAFQVIEFVINYFGNIVVTEHDTKIMQDGKQFVIGGCGYIKDGFEVVA